MLHPLRMVALLAGLTVVSCIPARAQGTVCPGLTAAPLLTCLRAAYTPASTYSYDRARDTLFSYVDDGDRALITDIYAGRTLVIPPGEDPTKAGCNGDGDNNASTCNGALNFNTEHAYPQSKGASIASATSDPTNVPCSGCDMHHLYPARADVNSSRGNNAYASFADAQASKFYFGTQTITAAPSDPIPWSATSTALGRFRPRSIVRGDLARSIFYFYTIYRTRADAADAAFFNLQKADLYAWHQADLPDAGEQARSARVRIYQGNDNPFVLDPTLVQRAYFPETLPVELVSFAAVANGPQVLLTWTTASETNNTGFTVEQQRPADAAWAPIGTVAGHGTTDAAQRYTFAAPLAEAGRYRFRLRQTDFDGTTHVSPVVEAVVGTEAPLALHLRGTTLTLAVREAQSVRVEVFDLLGRRVAVLLDAAMPEAATRTWDLQGTLTPGVYVVRALGATTWVSARVLIY